MMTDCPHPGPFYDHGGIRILAGDCRTLLAQLPADSVQTVVTSPPYFGLRDYDHSAQLGREETPAAYVAELVEVFRHVRRVLHPKGTLWLNLGDSAAAGGQGAQGGTGRVGRPHQDLARIRRDRLPGFKPKDLLGIPWRTALALQADGWWLRADVIWHKPNPRPEAVKDRPTRAHEYLFLLSKSRRYYYDYRAIAEQTSMLSHGGRSEQERTRRGGGDRGRRLGILHGGLSDYVAARHGRGMRNKRDVWTVRATPFPDAHFAVMPAKLVAPCILAGSRPGDLVLDPFAGAGTTLLVAKRLERRALGLELNPAYCAMAARRLPQDVLTLEGAS